jgi:hypothetical protein
MENDRTEMHDLATAFPGTRRVHGQTVVVLGQARRSSALAIASPLVAGRYGVDW